MDLDPRYLQAFVEVARANSFSKAAGTLHKTQPAVSYQIRQLEHQLHARLFDRDAKRLTPAGRRLFALSDRFFREFSQLATALHDPDAAAEPLRIESVSAFGRYVLFPVLSAMPELRYSLRFPTAEQVYAALHAGTCDLGIVYQPHVSSRLVATELAREELVVIAPGSGPASRVKLPPSVDGFVAPDGSQAGFAGLPAVTYDECEYVFGKWFEAVYRRQPRSVSSAYHFEELEEVVATVAAGRGWSIVPAHCVASTRRVACIRHSRRRVYNAIYALTRPGDVDHPAIGRVIAAVRSTGRD